MKTIWNYSWAAVAMLAALASCQKENDQAAGETLPSAPEKGRVTLTASIPAEGLTKVSFTEADNGSGKMRLTKLSWEADDVITVNGNEFTVKEGSISEDGLSATFQGEDPGNGPYNIAYTSAPDDLNNQTQPADGDAGNLGYSVSLTGADAYEEVAFTSAWAGSHGAAFAQSSVLQLRATLPAAVASAVQRVVFKSSAAIFNGRDSLTVKLTTPGTAGEDNKLDIYAMLPAGDVTLAEDMDLLVQFQVSDKAYDKYTAFRHFASGTPFIQSGATQYLGLNCSNITSYANASTTSIGTSANPYLIGDQHQMQAIADLLTAAKSYVKMVDDIDMTGFSESLSTTASTKVDFSGNNKTIRHLSRPLFSALFGGVHELIFADAAVSVNGNDKGILAQTAGSDIVAGDTVAENITIKGSSIGNTNQRTGALIGRLWGNVKHVSTDSACSVSGGAQTGGLVGRLEAGTIEDCSTAGSVTSSSYYHGGLVGMVEGGTINHSSSSATVTNNLNGTQSRCGGLVGMIEAGTVLISYCHTIGDVSSTVSGKGADVGGLIGQVTPASGKTISLIVEKSYATGNVSNNGYNRVGGLIGEISGGASANITDCYYSGELTCSNYSGGLIGWIDGSGTSVTITRGYTNATISGSGKYIGVLCHAGSGNVTCSNFVGWNTSGKTFSTGSSAPAATGNYCGTSGSIYSQAVTLGGWDFTNVWTTDATPQLRPYVAPVE